MYGKIPVMKILLTGASGLLGRTLFRDLKASKKPFDVTGAAFSRSAEPLRKIDLTDRSSTLKFIAGLSPDLIIHAAAERKPDIVQARPEAANQINVEATETVALAAENCGAAVLYMSTNYIFDGKNPPYYPESVPNPLNTYGRMKLAGEKKILELCSKPVILRIPVLYGNVEYPGESPITIIAENMKPDKATFFDNTLMRYPTHVADVSGIICGLAYMLSEGKNIEGIYHWGSSKAYTKFEIAQIIAEISGINKDLIREAAPDPNAAPRPKNAELNTERLRSLGLGSETDFVSAIKSILDDFK